MLTGKLVDSAETGTKVNRLYDYTNEDIKTTWVSYHDNLEIPNSKDLTAITIYGRIQENASVKVKISYDNETFSDLGTASILDASSDPIQAFIPNPIGTEPVGVKSVGGEDSVNELTAQGKIKDFKRTMQLQPNQYQNFDYIAISIEGEKGYHEINRVEFLGVNQSSRAINEVY